MYQDVMSSIDNIRSANDQNANNRSNGSSEVDDMSCIKRSVM